MSPALLSLIQQFRELSPSEMIDFLKTIHKEEPFKWDYATMSEPLQKFYTNGDR